MAPHSIWISWRETHHPNLEDWTSKSPIGSWKVAHLQPFFWGVFSNHHGLKSLGPAWITTWHLSKSIKYTTFKVTSGHLCISKMRKTLVTGVVGREPEFELIQGFFCVIFATCWRNIYTYTYIYIVMYIHEYMNIWIDEYIYICQNLWISESNLWISEKICLYVYIVIYT